ncbi:MAG: permease [Myxococcales bacterium]|nr:permease [Myxococcales bacterium]
MTLFLRFLEAMWSVTLELAPWLLLGAAVASVLHVLLPAGFVRKSLRGRGGVLKAVLLGVPLPLCSCGVIPAGLGLKRDGASNGASIGFLTATPQTGVDSILVSASFLGWPFAVFKVLSALVLGMIAGTWTDAVDPGDDDAAASAAEEDAPKRTWRNGLDHGVELIQTIWRWLVFGVVVSAAITTFVPESAFAALSGHGGLIAMGATLLIALPLYVCATASVPIAAALVAGGFPAGAALVFLMAGPATNLATIGAVRRAFGGKALAIYLLTIGVGSFGLGWAFDFVIASTPMAAHAAHAAHHGASIPAMAAAVLLLAMFAWFASIELRSFVASRRKPVAKPIEVGVTGMTCNGCVRRLEAKLRDLPEVGAVEVELEGGVCRVENADLEAVREAIRQAGFKPAA